MCYALPGPRCSNHCFNDLAKARTAYLEAVEKVGGDEKSRAKFEAAKERYERAQARFDRSPEGQRLLREEAAALRPTNPERADALEALANEGAKAHKFEVGAHKKKTLVEQEAYERLHEEAMQTGEEAERIADQIADGAEGADAERLAALQGRVRELTAQYSTTPMGLQRIRAGIADLKARHDAAETDEQRATLKRGLQFRVNHLKESKEARARMLAEYHAKTKAREQADAFMKEARETGGLSALQAKETAPKTEPVASERDEASERRARFVAARRERREREDAARAEAEHKKQASVAKNPSAVLAAAEKRELKQWQHPKTGEVRFYPADQDEALGLDVAYYKSGSISSAAWQGESVSNSKAYSLKSTARELNPYIVDGEVRFSKNPRNSTEEEVAEKLRGYLEKKMAG